MEQQSISELFRSYRVEIFGVAVAVAVIVVIRFFYLGGKQNHNQQAKKGGKPKMDSKSNENSELVQVNLAEMKECEPLKVDVKESSILVVKDKSAQITAKNRISLPMYLEVGFDL